MKLKTQKALVVCADANDDLAARFAGAGWTVAWVYEAEGAIARVRRERFDLAVLISTGPEMDLTETFFNLRDIRESMAIVLVKPANLDLSLAKLSTLSSKGSVTMVQDVEDLVSLLVHLQASSLHRTPQHRPQP